MQRLCNRTGQARASLKLDYSRLFDVKIVKLYGHSHMSSWRVEIPLASFLVFVACRPVSRVVTCRGNRRTRLHRSCITGKSVKLYEYYSESYIVSPIINVSSATINKARSQCAGKRAELRFVPSSPLVSSPRLTSPESPNHASSCN